MKNRVCINALFATIIAMFLLCGCTADATAVSKGTALDMEATKQVSGNLASNQPTPKDIEYSLERYNLIRRAYWVNGQREKANTLPCEIDKPLGYIVLFSGNATVGRFVVDGKVSSLNSYLSPDSEYYEYIAIGDPAYVKEYANQWLADVDGSYGENDSGIFFFTPDGKYIEWTGDYLYSDIPFEINDAMVSYKEITNEY